MKIQNFIHTPFRRGISGLWYASGDFGILDGTCKFTNCEESGKQVYAYETEQYRIRSEFTFLPGGVALRQDTLENISSQPIQLNTFFSRFCLDGNQYQVYTQFNSWQHESSGAWQDLVTQISAVSSGIRTCDSAAPMMALRNKHNGLITVFHLLPNAQWQMAARRLAHRGQNESVVLETGFENNALRMPIAPGQVIKMPAILFYQTRNATDLDAYKLHIAYNSLYPRKKLPILYNTWFYHFDNIDVDALLRQVDCAAELGVEIFTADAGWSGDTQGWATAVGDWEESLVRGYKGRLLEVSQRVRQKGMIFGLWMEPERCGVNSRIFKERPDLFLDHIFFDFSKPEARDFMVETVSKLVDTYHIGFLKFDFNATTPHDFTGCSFYHYMAGYEEFIQRLRDRYPHLYISGVAAGGFRNDLYHGTLFDSFWFTDNQGPYEGLTILKDTMKRMPGSLIERWSVQKYCDGFPVYGTDKRQGFMLSCNNSEFDYVINVKDDYTQAFLTGGPIGFSGDIDGYPQEYKDRLKAFLATYKQDREFYMQATARILVDSEEITAIQYADPQLTRSVILFFTKLSHAVSLTVYPAVDPAAQYQLGEQTLSGAQIAEDGICFTDLRFNDCQTVALQKV